MTWPPGIEPNGASNDFRWKAVTFEGDGVHPKRLHRNHQIEIRALNVTMPVARPPARDPKRFRVFVVVSRQALIDLRFSTIICAPVYSTRHGLATQVDVGLNEGLRHDSSVHCDELVSLRKSQLTQFVGTFDTTKLKCLDDALMVALGLLRS